MRIPANEVRARAATWRRGVLGVVLIMLLAPPGHAAAPATPSPSWAAHVPNAPLPADQLPPSWQALATELVRDNLPASFADQRHWEQQRSRWNGLEIDRDGWQLHTRRKRKAVNHGTWHRYEVRLLDPGQHLQVQLLHIREAPDGRAAFQLQLAAKINAVAQVAQWSWGVQLLSMKLDADAHVLITVDCLLDVRLDPAHLPPDLVLTPEVVGADVQLRDFHVNRLSYLDGPAAKELSRGLERWLNDKLDEKRPQLVTKLNQQLERHRDDLRWSLQDVLRDRASHKASPK